MSTTVPPSVADASRSLPVAATRRWSTDRRLTLRLLGLGSVAAAETCTRLAADRTYPLLTVAVALTALAAIAAPERHLGLPAIGLVACSWGVSADDATSPWVLGVAGGVLGFHVCLAAFGVAPPGARWTDSMRRRWIRRTAGVAAAAAPAWAVAAVLGGDVGASGVLVTVALLAIALWARWARSGSPPRAADPGTTA